MQYFGESYLDDAIDNVLDDAIENGEVDTSDVDEDYDPYSDNDVYDTEDIYDSEDEYVDPYITNPTMPESVEGEGENNTEVDLDQLNKEIVDAVSDVDGFEPVEPDVDPFVQEAALLKEE